MSILCNFAPLEAKVTAVALGDIRCFAFRNTTLVHILLVTLPIHQFIIVSEVQQCYSMGE